MTAEEFSNIEKEFREMDECGFAPRYMYLGNHIRLTDGTDLGLGAVSRGMVPRSTTAQPQYFFLFFQPKRLIVML